MIVRSVFVREANKHDDQDGDGVSHPDKCEKVEIDSIACHPSGRGV